MKGCRFLSRDIAAVVLVSILSMRNGYSQNAPSVKPTDLFQGMFEKMASQSGPLAPMFGKLTPEQKSQIDRIKISVAEEKQFGQQILNAYLEQLKTAKISITQRGKEVAYLRLLLETVVPCMQNAERYKQLDVRCIESDHSDAYSIPGGHLLVTRGLLESASSEAAIVGVLAHELSHLDHGHQLIPLKQSKLAKQPLDFQDRMLWVSLIARPVRPEQESEADSDATLWMMKADYDPRELAHLLHAWRQKQEQNAPWMNWIPGFVKSHPDAGRRAQEVLQIAERNFAQFPNATYIGVENLQQRTPRSVRRFR